MHMALLLSALLLCALPAQAGHEWPDRIVRIEDLQLVTPITIEVPGRRATGEVKEPAVLRVHVDASGAVSRVVLLESSGSPGHDSGAVRAMRTARFKPYLVDGTPADVTLVVPLHLPLTRNPDGTFR